MKSLILILSLTLCYSCASQVQLTDSTIEKKSGLRKPTFKNQGEQEDYWAQEFFKKEYKPEKYLKYSGEIKIREDNRIHFGQFQAVEIFNTNSENNMIFTKGLFYPDILGLMSLKIGNLEEVKFLSDSPKIKRFRFWLYRPNMANPQVYFFELTNNKATERTEWNSFIENARLTFVKGGWIII